MGLKETIEGFSLLSTILRPGTGGREPGTRIWRGGRL